MSLFFEKAKLEAIANSKTNFTEGYFVRQLQKYCNQLRMEMAKPAEHRFEPTIQLYREWIAEYYMCELHRTGKRPLYVVDKMPAALKLVA